MRSTLKVTAVEFRIQCFMDIVKLHKTMAKRTMDDSKRKPLEKDGTAGKR